MKVKFLAFFIGLLLISSLDAFAQNEHTVATGETLSDIATKYGVSITDLKSINTGLDDYVFAGMVLKIPSQAEPKGGKTTIVPVDDLKDVIYLKDGSELVAKVVKIETAIVQFEQYDTDDLFSINKELISYILFEDGRKTNFSPVVKKKSTSKRKRTR